MNGHWSDLADFNTEVSRGVVHSPEHRARMAERQAAFDEEQRRFRDHDLTPTLWCRIFHRFYGRPFRTVCMNCVNWSGR